MAETKSLAASADENDMPCSTCGTVNNGIHDLNAYMRTKGNKSALRAVEALPAGSDFDMFYLQHWHALFFEEKVVPSGDTVTMQYAQWLALRWARSNGAAAFLVAWKGESLCTECSCIQPGATTWVASFDALGGFQSAGWYLDNRSVFVETDTESLAAGIGEWFLSVADCENNGCGVGEPGCTELAGWAWHLQFDSRRRHRLLDERVTMLREMGVRLPQFDGA